MKTTESPVETRSRDLPVVETKTEIAKPRPLKGSAPVWIGVGIVFSLLAMAWTGMFFFASKYRAADVPLATRAAAKPEAR